MPPLVTLLIRCTDRTGIVAALSNFIADHGGNIVDADQHSEAETGRFFMRIVFTLDGFDLPRDEIAPALDRLNGRFDLHYALHFSDRRPRVAVMCSKTPHCVYDLLVRQTMNELGGDIVLVMSNHTDLEKVSEHFGVPFLHTPVTADTRAKVESTQRNILREHNIDLVVLARYMQVLSGEFCDAWRERIINIHHSFLPAFAGARPYHQAKERGVKIIGATAHYVTQELDAGPIIEQDVIRVTHRDSVDDLVQKGRDIERRVLATAVKLHLDRRVLVEGNRTIVFH